MSGERPANTSPTGLQSLARFDLDGEQIVRLDLCGTNRGYNMLVLAYITAHALCRI